jgi:hypothetical protein
VAVEPPEGVSRRREKRARLAEDVIGAAELPILALQHLKAILLRGRRACFLGLSHPPAERFRRTPQLGGDGPDGRLLRAMVRRLLPHQPNGALPNFPLKLAPLAFGHASNLSQEGVSSKSGAVQILNFVLPLSYQVVVAHL